MSETIQDRALRYVQDALDTHGKGFPEWEYDDLEEFRDYVRDRFTPEDSIVLHVYDTITREFDSGHRCAVCGRTAAQSAAIGYNCAESC